MVNTRTFIPKVSNGSLVCSGCSSRNGNVLAVCFRNGYIYVSQDAGITWTQVASSLNWYSICANADGTILYASVNNGSIWQSTNSGTTWTELTTLGTSRQWWGVCCDDTGNNLLACVNNGSSVKICIKTSSGFSFPVPNGNNATQGFRSCCCSSDFTKLYICCDTGEFYHSTNSGATWIQDRTVNSSNQFTSVCCSSDGVNVFTTAYNSINIGVLYSNNSGVSYSNLANASVNSPWQYLSCNNIGNTVALCGFNNRIYIVTTEQNDTWEAYGNPPSPWQTISIINKDMSGKNISLLATTSGKAYLSSSNPIYYTINDKYMGINIGTFVAITNTNTFINGITNGWIICDGTPQSNTTGVFTNLANIGIGTLSNNNNTYTPPNLNGLIMTGKNSTGSIVNINTTQGNNTIILNTNNLPVHNHVITIGEATHTHTYNDLTPYEYTSNQTESNASGQYPNVNKLSRTTGSTNDSHNHTITIDNVTTSTGNSISIKNQAFHIKWIVKYA